MPHYSKKNYDPIEGVPVEKLYSEDSFKHGVQFFAKYVGTLDVPRPQNRLEIVAAMRRIRYEFKAKAIKKRKIIFTVSVDGVFVNLRKSRKKHQYWDMSSSLLLHHPIYRIFYVSHDSQDLKIFSYIARDSQSNVFKCHVFKSYKKGQAMRIVRTVGQAFDVCHKLNGPQGKEEKGKSDSKDREAQKISEGKDPKAVRKALDLALSITSSSHDNDDDEEEEEDEEKGKMSKGEETALVKENNGKKTTDMATSPVSALLHDGPLSTYHQIQLLRQQLEQQTQQTQVALSQVQLLKDQLAAESSARLEAQARVHQLIIQNRDLLEHLNQTVHQIQQLEAGQRPGLADRPASLAVDRNTASPSSDGFLKDGLQTLINCSSPSPSLGPLILSGFPELDTSGRPNGLPSMYRNKVAASTAGSGLSPGMSDRNSGGARKQRSSQDSPDSGHKEMSADSLSQALNFAEIYPPASERAKAFIFASDDTKFGWQWSGWATEDSGHDDTPLATSVHSVSTNETTCLSDSETQWRDENANNCLPAATDATTTASSSSSTTTTTTTTTTAAATTTVAGSAASAGPSSVAAPEADLSPVSSTTSQNTTRPALTLPLPLPPPPPPPLLSNRAALKLDAASKVMI